MRRNFIQTPIDDHSMLKFYGKSFSFNTNTLNHLPILEWKTKTEWFDSVKMSYVRIFVVFIIQRLHIHLNKTVFIHKIFVICWMISVRDACLFLKFAHRMCVLCFICISLEFSARHNDAPKTDIAELIAMVWLETRITVEWQFDCI